MSRFPPNLVHILIQMKTYAGSSDAPVGRRAWSSSPNNFSICSNTEDMISLGKANSKMPRPQEPKNFSICSDSVCSDNSIIVSLLSEQIVTFSSTSFKEEEPNKVILVSIASSPSTDLTHSSVNQLHLASRRLNALANFLKMIFTMCDDFLHL